MANETDKDATPERASPQGGNPPAQPIRPRTPRDPFADMRHAAPRPSPYEALESAGPPV